MNSRKYKARLSVVSALVAVLLLSATMVQAQNAYNRNNLAGIEFLGRGLLYSMNYERYVKRAGFGVGIATWRIDRKTVAVIPAHVSFRPIGNTNSLYLAAGATVGSRVNTLFDSPSVVFGTTAVGYEHVSGSGLVIRPTANFLFDRSVGLLWPGLSIAYRF